MTELMVSVQSSQVDAISANWNQPASMFLIRTCSVALTVSVNMDEAAWGVEVCNNILSAAFLFEFDSINS